MVSLKLLFSIENFHSSFCNKLATHQFLIRSCQRQHWSIPRRDRNLCPHYRKQTSVRINATKSVGEYLQQLNKAQTGIHSYISPQNYTRLYEWCACVCRRNRAISSDVSAHYNIDSKNAMQRWAVRATANALNTENSNGSVCKHVSSNSVCACLWTYLKGKKKLYLYT